MFSKAYMIIAAAIGAVTALPLSNEARALADVRFPSLIVPLSQDQPDNKFGTQYYGHVKISNNTHQIWQEIQFDVPFTTAASCKLNFQLVQPSTPPAVWSLASAQNTGFDVYALTSQVTQADTWNSHPVLGNLVGSVQFTGNGALTVNGLVVPCMLGQTQAFVLKPWPNVDFDLQWFENKGPDNGVTYELYRN